IKFMLPDFPSLKTEILARLAARTRAGAQADPLLALMPAFVIHEGSRSRLIREDGTVQEMTFDNPLHVEAEIKIEDMAAGGPAASIAAVDELTQSLQEGMARRAFQAIEEAAESVGNAIQAEGRPFTPELYFEGLEAMELSFDDAGSWLPPTFIAHPDTSSKIEPVLASIEADPDLRARRDAIVDRQREEWSVREARRRLAD
ncbi:MAG: hypothetical protein ACRD1T_09170, partial [Acidimicrobiia bacterium]